MPGRFRILALCISASVLTTSAVAQVNFGKNVRIGGHDFSNRSYKSARIEMTRKSPPWLGCRISKAGAVHEGKRLRERTEICYLERIPENRRAAPR